MSSPGIRSLSLADLDQATLEQFVRQGEDLLVEFKQSPPKPPRFGAAVASLANALGGWILLGIADDRSVVGWSKPDRIDLQSHLGAILRNEVDPLPPFVAAMREIDGKPVAVLRVFPSADSPHIVRGTGAVYVRSSKGKEPVDDHRTLLDLARRGEDAERAARARLRELPVVGQMLRAPDMGYALTPEGAEVRFIVRAAPLTVTPALRQWPLTRRAAKSCEHFADTLVPRFDPAIARRRPQIETFGRAVAARLSAQHPAPRTATVVADSGGVVGIVKTYSSQDGRPPTILVNALLDDEIKPLLATLADLLYEAEAFGRVAVDLWIQRPHKSDVREQVRESVPVGLHVAGELTIPAEDSEVNALAHAWHRELQREFGIVKFEGESRE
jgi:hypothetical protein